MPISLPFMEGVQYISTIAATGSRLVDLEQALSEFKQNGLDASISSSSLSSVCVDIYASITEVPRRFCPPPITRQTAEAYERLIKKIERLGYSNISVFRDGRTGLRDIDEIPLFEVVDHRIH